MTRPYNPVKMGENWPLTAASTVKRRRRKPTATRHRTPKLRLYARAEPTERNHQVRAISKPDGRTRLGRIEKAFRQDLLDFFGGDENLNIIQRELVEQCVEMKVTCCEIRAKRAAGRASDYDAKRYSAAFNSLQRALIRLGYREKAAIERVRAEAQLTRANAKR